jgi:hypothetical protein
VFPDLSIEKNIRTLQACSRPRLAPLVAEQNVGLLEIASRAYFGLK